MASPDTSGHVTLRSLAQALGVSHVTVSLALRNSPKIPQARRQQIQTLAERMGYQPNAMATALAHQKHTSTHPPIKAALAWLNQWNPSRKLRGFREFDRYWHGASASAAKFGYHLEEFCCGEQMSLARLETVLLTRGIRGILLPPHLPGTDWAGLNWNRFAAVRFGRSIQNPRSHIVTSDQVANTMLAFRKVREHGYARVGFVTGQASERGGLFNAGFLMAQAILKREFQLPICVLDESAASSHRTKLARWLARSKPDAILTDVRGTRELLCALGWNVPHDIGLAALSILDGDADAGIDQHPEEIGRVAVLLAVSLINDNAFGIPPIFRQSLIEGSWVVGSTLPDRSSSRGKFPAALSSTIVERG